MMYQQQEHSGTSKLGISTEKQAARRRGDAVSLRAKKKEEMMRDKRGKVTETETQKSSSTLPIADVNLLSDYVRGVREGDLEQRQLATTLIRKLLSKAQDPPLSQVIATGVVQEFAMFLRADDQPKLQLEAAWAICNIASGVADETNYIIGLNTVPQFMHLLTTSNSEDLLDQCLWALGNIAGEPAGKEQMLSLGALEIIQRIVHNNPSETILRNATWCMSNLVRKDKDCSDPNRVLPLILPVLPTFRELLSSNDRQVVCDACWALSYISDGENNRIQLVMQLPDIVPTLMRIIAVCDSQLCSPALRTLGNFVTGSDEQTQQVIDAGLLVSLGTILSKPNTKEGIINECCWTISNVLLGTEAQRGCVFAAGLHLAILKHTYHDKQKIRKECVHGVANIAEHGTQEERKVIMENGCLRGLIHALTVTRGTNPAMVRTILRAIETLLSEAPEIDDYLAAMNLPKLNAATQFREDGGFEIVSSYTEADDQKIATLSSAIVSMASGDDGIDLSQVSQFGISAPQQQQMYNVTM